MAVAVGILAGQVWFETRRDAVRSIACPIERRSRHGDDVARRMRPVWRLPISNAGSLNAAPPEYRHWVTDQKGHGRQQTEKTARSRFLKVLMVGPAHIVG